MGKSLYVAEKPSVAMTISAVLGATKRNEGYNEGGGYLAANAATMVCSAVQFFLYFPVDKILFHKKKEEKTAE